MQLGYTIPDFRPSLKFNKALFQLTRHFLSTSCNYGERETGTPTQMFSNYRLQDRRRLTPMRAIEVIPRNQTIASMANINGFLVQLCTPMG